MIKKIDEGFFALLTIGDMVKINNKVGKIVKVIKDKVLVNLMDYFRKEFTDQYEWWNKRYISRFVEGAIKMNKHIYNEETVDDMNKFKDNLFAELDQEEQFEDDKDFFYNYKTEGIIEQHLHDLNLNELLDFVEVVNLQEDKDIEEEKRIFTEKLINVLSEKVKDKYLEYIRR